MPQLLTRKIVLILIWLPLLNEDYLRGILAGNLGSVGTAPVATILAEPIRNSLSLFSRLGLEPHCRANFAGI